MSIVLTKKIKGKKVALDIISLNGKATVRSSSLDEAKKKGITEADIKDAGFEIEGQII
jgi:hypothetical protein